MWNDLENPALPAHFWSWKKIILWPLGLLVALVVALWAYDEELEPYDDLAPLAAVDQDPARNGYFFLKARWENLPELSSEEKSRIWRIMLGRSPWDPGIMEALRKGRESLLTDVKEALEKSDFNTPSKPAFTDPQLLRLAWIMDPQRLLCMEILAAVREGENEKAMRLQELAYALSKCYTNGSRSLSAIWAASNLHGLALRSTNDLISSGNLGACQLQGLDALLREEIQPAVVWRRVVRTEADSFRGMIESIAQGRAAQVFPERYKYVGLLLKINKTINRGNERHRALANLGSGTFSGIQEARDAGYFEGDRIERKWTRYLDANYTGTLLLDGAFGDFQTIQSGVRNKMLFQPRALRVKIAILRWRGTHPGQWPATLRELVPDFLTEVPEDPFNGRDLEWDPVKRIIFSVGSDWLANDPEFKDAFAWFAAEHESPGLRMERPPAPPLAVPSSKPKS